MDVVGFVAKCLTCQTVKVEHQKPVGTLQSLPLLERKWGSITMDFLVGLPNTQSQHDAIWVVVNRMTKLAYFMPTTIAYNLGRLAQLYVKENVKLLGIPN